MWSMTLCHTLIMVLTSHFGALCLFFTLQIPTKCTVESLQDELRNFRDLSLVFWQSIYLYDCWNFLTCTFFVDEQQNDKIMEIILLNHLFFQTCSVWPPLIHQNLTISTHHINIQIFSRVFFNFISMCVLPFSSFITVTTMNSSAQHRAPLSTMWLFAFINCFFFVFFWCCLF